MSKHKRKRRPMRRKRPWRLMIKFRVRPLVRMPKSELFRQLQEMAHTGVAPAEVEVAYMDFSHVERNGKFHPGDRLGPDDLREFRKFYQVLMATDPGQVTAERLGKSVRFEQP